MLKGVLGILTLKSITNLRFKLSFSKSWLILQFQNMIYGVWKNIVYSKITIPNTHIFAFLIKTRVKSFSTRLFGRFEPKKHVLQKAGATCAYWAKANNALRTRKPYRVEKVHKTKSPMRVCNYPLALPSIAKLPLIKVLSSHAWSSLSILSSHISALPLPWSSFSCLSSQA